MLNNIEKMKALWHSSSQILSQGVKKLYPEAKLAIGDASAVSYTHLTLPTNREV